MRKKLLLNALVLSTFLPAASLYAEIALNFGVYTTDKPTTVVRTFKPALRVLAKDLTQRLNEPVTIRIQVANSYEKGTDDITEGRVDLTRLGPVSYILVKEQSPEIDILAIESKKGKKRFNGVICVHQDSTIQQMEDLRGLRFAFGNEQSTIGRYLSQKYLNDHGIKAVDLAGFDYLGRHDKVGHAVGSMQYHAGALKESTFKKLVKKGVPIRALATFPNVTKPWVARAGLDKKIKEALSESLLSMDDPEALSALGKDGFVSGDDDDYAIIRSAMSENTLFFE
ncbi:MAG: PhnD/SsuA/transferrin family substrate-binding protein [Sedimenticola sp.]